MPPKKVRRVRRGGASSVRSRVNRKPSIFILPDGTRVPGSQAVTYGGNFQNGTGFFSDLGGKLWSGVKGIYNTGKKVYDFAKKVNPSKYLDMVNHPIARQISAPLKQVGLSGTRRRVMVHGNAAALP